MLENITTKEELQAVAYNLVDSQVDANKELNAFFSEKTIFLPYVHDKGGATTSTIALNSSILFAKHPDVSDVFLLDINNQNPAQDEMTREIRMDKFVMVYDRELDYDSLDMARIDKDNFSVVKTPAEVNMNDKRIEKILITEEAYEKNPSFVEATIAKNLNLYVLKEYENGNGNGEQKNSEPNNDESNNGKSI
ncbi:MAG: hypothetical protein Q8O89_02095, partial [Nanoarchaeota archaeon]|nr:hypothetical protein [Nanoarchaeota archaeon]